MITCDFSVLSHAISCYKQRYPVFSKVPLGTLQNAIDDMTGSSAVGKQFRSHIKWKVFSLRKKRDLLIEEVRKELTLEVENVFAGRGQMEIWGTSPKFEIRPNDKIFSPLPKERTFMGCSPLMYIVTHILWNNILLRFDELSKRKFSQGFPFQNLQFFNPFRGGVDALVTRLQHRKFDPDYSSDFTSLDSSGHEASFTHWFFSLIIDNFYSDLTGTVEINGTHYSFRKALNWARFNLLNKIVLGPDGFYYFLVGREPSGFFLTLFNNTLATELCYYYSLLRYGLKDFMHHAISNPSCFFGDDSLIRFPKQLSFDTIKSFINELGFVFTLECQEGSLKTQSFLNSTFCLAVIFNVFNCYIFKPNLDKLLASIVLKNDQRFPNRVYCKMVSVYILVYPLQFIVDDSHSRIFHDKYFKLMQDYRSYFEEKILAIAERDEISPVSTVFALDELVRDRDHRLMELNFGVVPQSRALNFGGISRVVPKARDLSPLLGSQTLHEFLSL